MARQLSKAESYPQGRFLPFNLISPVKQSYSFADLNGTQVNSVGTFYSKCTCLFVERVLTNAVKMAQQLSKAESYPQVYFPPFNFISLTIGHVGSPTLMAHKKTVENDGQKALFTPLDEHLLLV